jgi:hypothetical protein
LVSPLDSSDPSPPSLEPLCDFVLAALQLFSSSSLPSWSSFGKAITSVLKTSLLIGTIVFTEQPGQI